MAPRNPDESWLTTFTSATTKLYYKESPVSILEFIRNEKFLGKLTKKDGIPGKAIYPVWKRELSFIMEEPTKYISILTGAIGVGKSRASIIGIAYIMYLHLCLRSPFQYYNLGEGGKMAIVFFNLNKSLGQSKGFRILQNYLLSSEWFRERGTVSGNRDDTRVLNFNLFEYILASPHAQAELGQDVIAALMDEVDSPKGTGKAHKENIIKSVESALRRFENRFVIRGQTLGKFFIVASKQEKLSYVNAFIAKKKNHPGVYVVDIPEWEAKEEDFKGYSKFPIRIGDIYTPSKILSSEEEVREALSDGFEVIHVPETPHYRRAFEEDLPGALRDLAGVSANYLRKNKLFKSEKPLIECYDRTRENPVSRMTIYLGTKDTQTDLIHFLDVDKISAPRHIPRFIHGDIAFSHDAYGLAMSCVSGWAEVSSEREDGSLIIDKLPVIETDFIMRIKAPENDEIDLSRIRKFIIDLKKIHGFNIHTCSFDLKLASADTAQILGKAGINCEYMSVDKNPQFCRNFRDDLVKQGRWRCYRHEYLHYELSNLEEDPNTNKIDHPKEVVVQIPSDEGEIEEKVLEGSKDLSDAVIGSSIKALQECKTPPNIEVMRKAFNKSQEEEEKDRNAFWWVDEGSIGRRSRDKDEEAEEVIRKDYASQYREIYRKSQS